MDDAADAGAAELGLAKAGIYLMGRGRYALREVAANNLSWLLAIGGLWIAIALAIGLRWSSVMPGDLGSQHFLVFALGGACLLLAVVKDLLIGRGSILGYNLLEFIEPFLRAVLILVAVFALGVGIVGVLFAWLLAIAIASVLALRMLAQRTSLRPSFTATLFREQLSFGLRGYLWFIFQAVNYRLDVCSTALGYYAVAFRAGGDGLAHSLRAGCSLLPKGGGTGPAGQRRSAGRDLQAGRPVVAARSEAISYVFGSESLAYFRPGDDRDLARRVIELYRDPKLGRRLTESACRDLQTYRWEVASAQYVNLHRELIESRNENA